MKENPQKKVYGHREDSKNTSKYPPHPHPHPHRCRADEDHGGWKDISVAFRETTTLSYCRGSNF